MGWIPSYKKPDSGGGSYVPPTWSDGTDAEIVEALEKHYAGEIDLTEYWSVGDERIIHLSAMSAYSPFKDTQDAQDVVMVLSNVGGKTLTTPINGHTECVFQVDQKDCLIKPGAMQKSSGNNYWAFSDRRDWCNSTYKNAFPSTLIEIFKEFTNVTGEGGSIYNGNVAITTDIFTMRTEKEVLNTTSSSWNIEGSYASNNQVTWYQTSTNRIKQSNGSNGFWWLRSPKKGNASDMCRISTSGAISYTSATTAKSNYFAPFGVI